jgi:hypothetical protein
MRDPKLKFIPPLVGIAVLAALYFGAYHAVVTVDPISDTQHALLPPVAQSDPVIGPGPKEKPAVDKPIETLEPHIALPSHDKPVQHNGTDDDEDAGSAGTRSNEAGFGMSIGNVVESTSGNSGSNGSASGGGHGGGAGGGGGGSSGGTGPGSDPALIIFPGSSSQDLADVTLIPPALGDDLNLPVGGGGAGDTVSFAPGGDDGSGVIPVGSGLTGKSSFGDDSGQPTVTVGLHDDTSEVKPGVSKVPDGTNVLAATLVSLLALAGLRRRFAA